jgi:hypothetical protein
MKKLNTAVLIFLLTSLYAVPCFAQKDLLAKEDQAIPPDFGKDKSTLLVIKSPAGFQVNGALDNVFEKYYKGSYEIIKYKEQFEAPYRDTIKYRYRFNILIDMEGGKFTTRRPEGGFNREGPSNEYSYGITDIQSPKDYNISFSMANYKKLMEAYVKKLEEERKKNEL